MAKTIEGNCSVCGEYGKLTYEHIPPQSAFNNSRIKVKTHENLFENKSFLYNKHKTLNRGFGKFCLCSSCNNFFGNAYCKDYISIVKQCTDYYENNNLTNINNIPLKIKPLNVLKQIIAIYVCLNNGVIDNEDKESIKFFLLDKENQNLPDKYSIFIYNTFKTKPRWIGNQTLIKEGNAINYSEMIFNPLGLQICYNSQPTNHIMVDITEFKKFSYNEEVKLIFKLPVLEFNNPLYNG